MAEKGFGVKEVNLIGASGTPTITSPNNLNLNANNVAISTNVSIGGTLSVTGNVSVGGTLTYEDVTNIDSVGLITARNGLIVTSGVSTFNNNVDFAQQINVTGDLNLALDSGTVRRNSKLLFMANSGTPTYYAGTPSGSAGDHVFRTFAGGFSYERFRIGADGDLGLNGENYGTSGQVLTSGGSGSAASWSSVSITPTATDVQVAYELLSTSASGAGWRITGNGIVNTVNNPDLYLIRGQKYRFINNSGGSHPFRIQSTSSTAYDTGVTNNNASSGNIDFVPRNDAPSRLYYNCTSHGGMLGNIYLRGAGGNETNVGVTTFTGAVRQTGNPVFMAYRVNNYNLTSTESELVYDSEKIDVGGNYNPSNGRFTAPVDGLYEFGYASIAKNTQTVYRYLLKVNGNDPYSPLRMELRIDQNNQTAYGTNGEFVVYVNMTAGQHASIYAKSDTNVNNVYGNNGYGYTYFRGRLIG